jgi:hypothetical protein
MCMYKKTKFIILTILSVAHFLGSSSQLTTPFRSGNLWGYKDMKGNIRIEPQYQFATKFILDIAIVGKNDTLAAIDTNNNLIIPFKYQYLRLIDTSEFLFGHRAYYFGEYNLGVMSKDQKIKIPAEYRHISKFNGYYRVTKQKDSIIKKSETGDVRSVKTYYGLIDNNGLIKIPCTYDYLDWKNDSVIVLTKGGLGINQALFNKRGEQLTGFEYMVFGKFIEGVAKARIGDKFGFIYPTGKIAIPIDFDYCEDFQNGYAIIKQKDKWGAINKEGKTVIEPNFEYQEVKVMLEKISGS